MRTGRLAGSSAGASTSHSTLMSRSRSNTLLATVAVARVDGEATAAGDEADDLVAGQRVAALGEAHEEVVDTADPHALVRLRPRARRRARALYGVERGAGGQLVQQLVDGGLAVADGGQQVVGRRVAEVGGRARHLLAGQERRRVQPVLLRLALEQLAAELDGARALLDLEPLVDLGARARGLDELEPIAARVLVGRGHDLDDVALAQRGAQRDELAVDLGADAVLADLRVHGEGEVDRRGAVGQRLDVTLGREDIDLVGEEVDAHAVEELARVLGVLLGLDELAQPRERLVELVLARLLFLVEPVSGDAFFRDAVHLPGADLDLDRIALGADDRGVERLVHVDVGRSEEHTSELQSPMYLVC